MEERELWEGALRREPEPEPEPEPEARVEAEREETLEPGLMELAVMMLAVSSSSDRQVEEGARRMRAREELGWEV